MNEPLPKAPCDGCGQVETIMGSLCDRCEETRLRRERVTRAKGGVSSLVRQLESAPRLGSPEFAERVRAERLRLFAERYTFERGNALVIGNSGTGKTTAVNALVVRLAAEAVAAGADDSPIMSCRRTTGPRIARALRETRLGVECAELDHARQCHVLVLDEIGQEMADPRWLFELMDERYGQRVTITASGLTRAELDARYGTGAARRLVEPVGSVLDLFGGA
jgi:DNA replication protein DnaC